MDVSTVVNSSLTQRRQYPASISSPVKNEDVLDKKLASLRCRSQMNIHPVDEPRSPWARGTK